MIHTLASIRWVAKPNVPRPTAREIQIDDWRNSQMKRISLKRLSCVLILLFVMLSSTVSFSQSDVPRQTIAVTYPLEQQVTVKFRGTTRLPRLSGEARVRRQGRRGSRVELSIENLPRASELGGAYTTYVLWAISPEGRVDNMGEIKRSGNFLISSKIDVTTPLQTFSLIVTAEPHFLVRYPSRMVVLENLPPKITTGADVETVNVQYLGNSSDYFKDQRVPDVADEEYKKTPVSLLGARQAINLAKYAGATTDAPGELKEAQAQLELAEDAWRLKQTESEIDAAARRATSLGVKAEEMAESRRAARQRRDEVARRDEAVRDAEASTATANKRIEDFRTELIRERRARELSERDVASANEQMRDLRSEVARLRDEMQTLREERDDARVKLARIEGERRIERTQRTEEQKALEQRLAVVQFRQALAAFGTVRDTPRGWTIVLPESYWTNAKSAELTGTASSKLEPLGALLANNPDIQIVIESYTDNRGDKSVLLQLSQDRARIVANKFLSAGVEVARLQVDGFGADNPVSPNTTPAGRAKNRRTEMIFISTLPQKPAASQ
jgi:outer membrane protein OmpA-like peptidoglycan-associated protein